MVVNFQINLQINKLRNFQKKRNESDKFKFNENERTIHACLHIYGSKY